MSEDLIFMEQWLVSNGFFMYRGLTTEHQYIVSWEGRYAKRPYTVQDESANEALTTLFNTVKEDLINNIAILENDPRR